MDALWLYDLHIQGLGGSFRSTPPGTPSRGCTAATLILCSQYIREVQHYAWCDLVLGMTLNCPVLGMT
jgi:hypothetical protein